MNECCSITSRASRTPPNKGRCPVNGKMYSSVSAVTIKHHISEPWNWHAKTQGYYFCEDPDCDVVYFGEDSSLIYKCDVRTHVGIKEKSGDRMVCYCFGVSMDQAQSNKSIKPFILRETKEHACACETRNPSGRCCLKDFPKG